VSVPVGDPANRTVSEWAEDLGAVGLDTTIEAVVCDETITPALASMFWLLEHLGHPQVSVCGEGLSGWTAAGWELTDVPTPIDPPEEPLDVGIHPTTFDPTIEERVRVRAPDDAKLHASFPRLWVVVSDAVPAALAGEEVARVPWQDNLTAAGRMKSAPDLWTLYEAQGTNHYTEVVVAGDDWREAAVGYLALRLLGLPMVRLYVPGDGEP
jgi:thiosulfate/3-mercaptopyruvate sulfurtransferase